MGLVNFLFGDRTGEMQSIADIITADMTKLNLSKLAIEKSMQMIAKAIAKSDFKIYAGGRNVSEKEYRLNVQPNDHETGTEFWMEVVKNLLTGQDVLIVRMGGKYYRAHSWQNTKTVLTPRTFYDVTLTCGGETYAVSKRFNSEEVIFLHYDNAKIRNYLENVVRQYDKTVDSINAMMKTANTPKFKLIVDGATSFREKAAKEGEPDKVLTADQYIAKLKAILESDELAILKTSANVALEHFKIESSVKAEELAKMAKEINSECAMAFDIPEAVYFGNITEKSDATNEFITYAVSPVAEALNDELNAKIVGMDDYCKGERIFVWMARFKHVDVVDSAASLDKLRGIGFNYDEIREMVGYQPLNTEFSTARALTKNYSSELGGEQGAS